MGLLDARRIKGIDDYLISPEGEIISLEREIPRRLKNGTIKPYKVKAKIKKKVANSRGWESVGLIVNGKTKGFRVNRLVAMAFIPNPENKPEVNHKNGIKNDNNVENLEWATSSENLKHSFRSLGRIQANIRKVRQLKDGVLIKEWDSITKAARHFQKGKTNNITSVCNGKRNECFGFQWEYAD